MPDPAPDHIVDSFPPDRATYIRDHAWMAAIAMAAGMATLWVMGNPHVWTGAVGGLAAIAIRGWYMMSEELGHRWELTATHLSGPGGRSVSLGEIKALNGIFSAVQVVTNNGDKHLIKYQADRADTVARLKSARTGAAI